MQPRLLITGHRGLLGSACVRRLVSKYDIMIYIDNLLDEKKFRLWMADNKPDYVIHCAAKVGGVGANLENPTGFLKENLKIQSNVIEASADFKVSKLVFVATSCLYPHFTENPIKEESLFHGPFHPSVEPYAVAKLAGYELCKTYREQYDKNFMTVCPANLYGPNDNYGPSAHVIPSLIKKLQYSIKTGNALEVWGDGSAIREFIYADDAADAIGVVLEKWNSPNLINIGTGIGTSIEDLVYTLFQVYRGPVVNVYWDKTKPTGIQSKYFDITKIKSLGWEPRISLQEGLKRTVESFIFSPQRCK